MPAAVLDHVFICTSPGAPVASRLSEFGLMEGTPNRHPGQGTACRRFFFQNAMLELIWVEDAAEAREHSDPRMRLWERWSTAGRGASPFGVILRPDARSPIECPFRSWEYRPVTMPGLVLRMAADTALEEPMWCYMENGRAPADWPAERRQPMEHPVGFRQVTSIRVVSPLLEKTSLTCAMANQGVIALDAGPEHLLELEFDDQRRGSRMDLRPDLPLVCRW